MSKTMAEVLADHAFHLITPVKLDDVNGPWQVECNCTADPIQGPSYLGAEQAFAAHQAAALSAAGFGLVADAKAEVATVQELDALWLGSVVISQGVAYQRYGNNEWAAEGAWYETTQVELPAAVLHDPRPANLRAGS